MCCLHIAFKSFDMFACVTVSITFIFFTLLLEYCKPSLSSPSRKQQEQFLDFWIFRNFQILEKNIGILHFFLLDF